MPQVSQEGGERVLVVGCGGVGGVCAVGLVEGGHQVTAITHNDKITSAIRDNGLTAHIAGERHTVERRRQVGRRPANTQRRSRPMCARAIRPPCAAWRPRR